MPAKIAVGLHSVQTLGENTACGASANLSAWNKHRLWGFGQSGYLQKAPSMGIQTARMLGKSIVYGDSVSPDT